MSTQRPRQPHHRGEPTKERASKFVQSFLSLSPTDSDKRSRARELLNEAELAVSVQVLQEFYTQAMRPTRLAPLTPAEALLFLEAVQEFRVQAITLDVFRSAVLIGQRFGLAYWDSAILAAARAIGCDAVYSEDMSSEQDYDGVRVINPFGQ